MKKALIVVNLAGFLTFLWNDIKTLQEMGYTVSVAMNARMPDGSDAVEVEKLKKMKIDFFQIDFDTKNPLSRDNVIAYKQLKKVVNEEYDLIHCHTPIVGILTRMAAKKYRKTGTTVIYTTHAVELVSVFDKIKPCGLNSHGSCSNLHTPLRGGQQATVL